MTAITWPTNPAINEIHTANGVSWKWDGTSWNRQGGSIAEEVTEGVFALRPSKAEAEAATSSALMATAQSVRQYVGYESAELTWRGFRTSTDATPAAGTWTDGTASSPFLRTLRYRPHTAAEADAIAHKATAGAYIQQYQSSAIFRQAFCPVVSVIPVSGSDIPVIQMLPVAEISKGTFSANTDTDFSIIGSIRSLGARSRDFKNVGGNNQVTMDETFRNFPRRAGTTEYSEDWELDVFCTSVVSVIDTRMSGVTGWVNANGTKVGHARVQWSTDNGSTWTSSEEMTNIYNSNIGTNFPISAGYQIRPGHVGPVKVRWQLRRGSSVTWWMDRSQSFAAVG